MKSEKKSEKMGKKIAVVRVRGLVGINEDMEDTFHMLKLHRKNVCTVYELTPSIEGMLRKVKDFATWGEITDETLKEMESKRGEKGEDGKLKKFFRLSPPRKGFGRKGIKKAFSIGGGLGYRGEKMDDLIRRML